MPAEGGQFSEEFLVLGRTGPGRWFLANTVHGDAIASFDRLAMSLMIPLALRVGAVLSHAVFSYNISQAMEYSISTGHDITPFTYTSTSAHRLQGSGQGGSQSPTLCTNSSDVILDAVDEEGHIISLDHCV